jgi:hypothetical protein
MRFRRGRRRDVSVVAVVHNIPREAPRTLLLLALPYQRDIRAKDYEVIVVDNGSNLPFDLAAIEADVGNFRLLRLAASPAAAIKCGLAAAPVLSGTALSKRLGTSPSILY